MSSSARIWSRWRRYRSLYRQRVRWLNRHVPITKYQAVTRPLLARCRRVCTWLQVQDHEELIAKAFPRTAVEADFGFPLSYMHHKYRRITEHGRLQDITHFFNCCDPSNLRSLWSYAISQIKYVDVTGTENVLTFFKHISNSVSTFFWYDVYGVQKGQDFAWNVERRYLSRRLPSLLPDLIQEIMRFLHRNKGEQMRAVMALFFMMTPYEQTRLVDHYNEQMCCPT